VVSLYAKLGSLSRRSVHPAAPVLLTKNGPLGTRIPDAVCVTTPRLSPIQSLRRG